MSYWIHCQDESDDSWNTEDQKFHSSEKYGSHGSFVGFVIIVVGGIPSGILQNSEWIGNDMRTKIYLL
jgi:hypothetical protein